MKAKELIEHLKRFPSDSEVVLFNEDVLGLWDKYIIITTDSIDEWLKDDEEMRIKEELK